MPSAVCLLTICFAQSTATIDHHIMQKMACGEGGCGACAVVLSRPNPDLGGGGGDICMAVNSCLRPLASLHGWTVTTVEGLGSRCKVPGGKGGQPQPHPIQARLSDFNASQCGFCTPGVVCSLYAQVHAGCQDEPKDAAALAGALDGNLCRWVLCVCMCMHAS